MRGGETVIFDGKTLSQLFEDIYSISREKRKDIKNMVGELSKMVAKPEDAALIAPIIKDFLEVSVKNDDQLAKMAQIVQRMVTADTIRGSVQNDPAELLTEAEKEQLLRNATHELQEATKEIQEDLDLLSSKVSG